MHWPTQKETGSYVSERDGGTGAEGDPADTEIQMLVAAEIQRSPVPSSGKIECNLTKIIVYNFGPPA